MEQNLFCYYCNCIVSVLNEKKPTGLRIYLLMSRFYWWSEWHTEGPMLNVYACLPLHNSRFDGGQLWHGQCGMVREDVGREQRTAAVVAEVAQNCCICCVKMWCLCNRNCSIYSHTGFAGRKHTQHHPWKKNGSCWFFPSFLANSKSVLKLRSIS